MKREELILMNKRVFNILYVFDDNYAPHAGISMTSLLSNNAKSVIRIFCVGMGVSELNRELITKLVIERNQQIEWIDSTNAISCIESCETGFWNGSKATWMKVFVIWDLPDDVDTILYIDSDSIVSGDISSIAQIELGDNPTAQAYDSLGNSYANRVLKLDEYYNAGVILFNVKYWKQEGFKNDFMNHLERNVSLYRDNEQGLLNDYFRGKIVKLPLEFNYQGFLELFTAKDYISVYNDFPFYTMHEIEQAKDKAVICHFFRAFGDYPWHDRNMHPMRKLYEFWKEKSFWCEMSAPINISSLVFRTEKALYRILPKRIYLKLYRMIVERT